MQKRARRYAEKIDSFGGVLDPARSARSYALRLFQPSAALAPFVEHYWLVDWDLPPGASYEAEVLPRPNINLALMPDRGWITGITTGLYTYTCRGRGGVFGGGFRPGGFRPFFGRPVAELVDSTIEAETIFPAMTEAARRTVLAGADPQVRIARVEDMLLASGLPPQDEAIALAVRCVETARDDRSITSVASLARRCAMSQRSLQKLFQDHVGAGPKWIIRLYRLVDAAARATAGTPPNWTEVALDLGYADQSHFTNDFRRVIGRSPGSYAREANAE